MAIVASHFEITVRLVDEGANYATLRFHCQNALYADVVTAKTTLVAAIGDVTDCVIQRVKITEVWKNDSFSYPSNVETAAKVSCTIELEGGEGKKANLKVPGPQASMFGASGTAGFNTLNTSDADMATYLAMFENGNEFFISDGEFFETLISGKRIHSKQYDG